MACRVATGWADGMVRTGEDVYAKALSLISKMLRRYWCDVAVSYALCTYLTDPGEGVSGSSIPSHCTSVYVNVDIAPTTVASSTLENYSKP